MRFDTQSIMMVSISDGICSIDIRVQDDGSIVAFYVIHRSFLGRFAFLNVFV